jgi:RmuC family
VVTFVPSEGIYHAALAADPGLIDYGVKQQVLIATPTTLIGLLRAVHYGWRQELIAESAREIAETGRELHRRLAVFAEPFAKVGRQLGSAVVAYNDAVGSFDRRVVPQLRRIEAAGASSDKCVPSIATLEETPRRSVTDLAMAARRSFRGSRPSTPTESTTSRRQPCPVHERKTRSVSMAGAEPTLAAEDVANAILLHRHATMARRDQRDPRPPDRTSAVRGGGASGAAQL